MIMFGFSVPALLAVSQV